MEDTLVSDGTTLDVFASDEANSAFVAGDSKEPADLTRAAEEGMIDVSWSPVTSPSQSVEVESSLALESDPEEAESDSDTELPDDSEDSEEDISSDEVDGSDDDNSVDFSSALASAEVLASCNALRCSVLIIDASARSGMN
jgi:hypothetical protein